jgi:transcriptional regulator with XRE-family HTH domain
LERLGALLRNLRAEWGLSLREVKARTEVLAKLWGNSHYETSFGHLAKLERGEHDIRVSTLIALAHIYSRRPETLLTACLPENYSSRNIGLLDLPNATVFLTEGRLHERAESLSSAGESAEVPELTTLVAETEVRQHRYRRAMIGLKDRALYPILRPGAIITVDTQQRAIASPKEWQNDTDRPIYLLYTRSGYVCGWCQLTENGTVLNIVSHVMTKLDVLPLAYGKDVEVIGRVVAVTVCLEGDRVGLT